MLPDTNVLIYFFGGKEPYAGNMKSWIVQKRLILSIIVVAEFFVGASEEESHYLDALIEQTTVCPIDILIAKRAAMIRKQELHRKMKLHLPDCLIAAQCQVYKATLATTNPHDFPSSLPMFKFP